MRVARFSVGVAVVACVVALGGSAVAHVTLEPPVVPAGSTQSIDFTVDHGCAGSPTVRLQVYLPGGVSWPRPAPVQGWVTAVDGSTVTWSGGRLPDQTSFTVRVDMTLPDTPRQTILFPLIQTCEQGVVSWTTPRVRLRRLS